MGAIETLTEKAAFLRESLQKSQTITDGIVSILGSFDHRLSTLEAVMRPTQVPSLLLFSFLDLSLSGFCYRFVEIFRFYFGTSGVSLVF